MRTRDNRPLRRRRRAAGQVMAIFALMSVVLFAIVGLAVDAGLSYFTYNGAERAAAAAALAGAPYMPTGCTQTGPGANCTGAANTAAQYAATRQGFGTTNTVNGTHPTVTTTRYPSGCGGSNNPCDANKITATITVNVQSTFMRVLGFGNHLVTVSDTAFYLPPISLGQPGGQLGSSEDQLGSNGSYYFLRSEGYGNPRSEGDAFDPDNVNQTFSASTCDVSETTASQGTSTDAHEISANNGTDLPNVGTTLNSTASTGTNIYGQNDFAALPSRGGYDFQLYVPSGAASATPEVYNPAFAPDGGFNPGTNSSYNMHEQDGSFSGNSYTKQYSAMEYTIFQVNDVFDHTKDTPLSQVVFDPLNITITNNAVSAIVDVANGQTIPPASSAFTYIKNNVYHAWVNVANPPVSSTSWTHDGTTYNIIHVVNAISSGTLAPGASGTEYRLRADMLDYQGYRPVDDSQAVPCSRAHKGYAVRLTQTVNGVDTVCSTCTVSGIDELAIYTPVQATQGTGGFTIPVFSLPADYKGTTVDFYVYDPGDLSSGTNTLSVIDPDASVCGALTSTQGVPIYDLGVSRSTAPQSNRLVNSEYGSGTQPSTTTAAVNTIVNGTNVFNGHWLLFQLPIPSNYAGGSSSCNGGYWALNYQVGGGGTATDTITMVVGYEGAPVHLLG